MYNKNNLALDESFHSECSYRDAMLMYALFRNSPFEHRDEVPFYAWFTLVQYIRLQLAVLDRVCTSVLSYFPQSVRILSTFNFYFLSPYE